MLQLLQRMEIQDATIEHHAIEFLTYKKNAEKARAKADKRSLMGCIGKLFDCSSCFSGS